MGVPIREVAFQEEKKKEPEEDMLKSLDEEALSGIMVSLVAFQQQ